MDTQHVRARDYPNWIFAYFLNKKTTTALVERDLKEMGITYEDIQKCDLMNKLEPTSFQ